MATPVRRPADRALKYRHKLTEALELDQPTLAGLAVLLLRGPQTVGELRQRTERYVKFETIDDVERVIDRLQGLDLARPFSPAARSEPAARRGTHVDGGTDFDQTQTPAMDVADNELETSVATLEKRFDELLRRLGVDDL